MTECQTPRKTRTCHHSFPPFSIPHSLSSFHHPFHTITLSVSSPSPPTLTHRGPLDVPHTILWFLIDYLDRSTYDAHNNDSLLVLGAEPLGQRKQPSEHARQENNRPLRDRGTTQGLGKGGTKRHRKILRDNIQGITKPAIHHLNRRGGIKRISGLIYEET